MELAECILKRRDTRHFKSESVPNLVIQRALQAAHNAPSVGLTEPWRFILIESEETRRKIKDNFDHMRIEAESTIDDQQKLKLHKTLKLESIMDAPVGLAIFCAMPEENSYVLGTTTTIKKDILFWSVACAIQNLLLSLTDQGYSAGWVSVFDFEIFKNILNVPNNWEPMGYLCIGKPDTDYNGQPMLQKNGWKQRSPEPVVIYK